MPHSPVAAQAPPRYPGEDRRTTSRKELAGWYSYGWAAEVFVVCGVGEQTATVSGHAAAG